MNAQPQFNESLAAQRRAGLSQQIEANALRHRLERMESTAIDEVDCEKGPTSLGDLTVFFELTDSHGNPLPPEEDYDQCCTIQGAVIGELYFTKQQLWQMVGLKKVEGWEETLANDPVYFERDAFGGARS